MSPRSAWVVVAFGFALSACLPTTPLFYSPQPLFHAGGETLVLVPSVEGTNSTISITITQDGVSNSLSERVPFDKDFIAPIDLVQGPVTISAEISCGHVPGIQYNFELFASAVLPLDRWLPRECNVLQPLSHQKLDCDGVDIDEDGLLLSSNDGGVTRAFFHEGELGRWKAKDSQLIREFEGSVIQAGPFSVNEQFVVAPDFAYTPGSLARVVNGELTLWEIDAGLDVENENSIPCAALSPDRVVWCFTPTAHFETVNAQVPWTTCRLDTAGHGVVDCSSGIGLFVRQDLRTQRIVFRDEEQFYELLPGMDAAIANSRPLREGEITHQIGLETGDSRQSALYWSTGKNYGFLKPSPWLETFVVERLARANSDFVWKPEDGGTKWAPIPR